MSVPVSGTIGEMGAVKVASLLKAGDEVWYLPHECHAYNCNANNEYPWAVGVKQSPRMVANPDTGEDEVVEEVVEVEEGFLHRVVLPNIYRAPNPREAKKVLVALRPRKHWRAVVRNINPDGTVDLDVDSNVGTGMVTLHYNWVPLDEAKKTHHTCHAKGGAG